MVHIPGDKPYVPPPKAAKESQPSKPAETAPKPQAAPAKGAQIGRGPEYDAQGLSVRLAALAVQAKEKELKFEEIIQRVIDMTGITNPEAAMMEANKRLEKEIEVTLDEIKSNKDLMEEAEAWQEFADLLESKLNSEQVEAFFGLIKESIHFLAQKEK